MEWVRTCSDLSVCLQDDSGSEVVLYQGLVRLGDAQLPGKPSPFDACPAAGPRATVVARYGDVLSFALKRHEFQNRRVSLVVPQWLASNDACLYVTHLEMGQLQQCHWIVLINRQVSRRR